MDETQPLVYKKQPEGEIHVGERGRESIRFHHIRCKLGISWGRRRIQAKRKRKAVCPIEIIMSFKPYPRPSHFASALPRLFIFETGMTAAVRSKSRLLKLSAFLGQSHGEFAALGCKIDLNRSWLAIGGTRPDLVLFAGDRFDIHGKIGGFGRFEAWYTRMGSWWSSCQITCRRMTRRSFSAPSVRLLGE